MNPNESVGVAGRSAAGEAPLIELDDIRKRFRVGSVELEVLRGVSLAIAAGELVSIMGASGSGKSTLMNILGLLDRPSGGCYRFAGRDVSTLSEPEAAAIRNRRIGFVFQQFNLLPRLDARDNIGMPLLYRGLSRRQAAARAEPLLEAVGMAERGHHRPDELSGGQQQRVAIARALVGEPALILADEPTGALDRQVGEEIMELFVRLNREQGVCVVVITHDPEVAARCTRRVVMRDGVLVEEGEAGRWG
ncbi:ABC transporter ATP-binding protein [Endothiovibrio diazotrophicus]